LLLEAVMGNPGGPIMDPQVNAVVARLAATRRRPPNGGPLNNPHNVQDPRAYAEYGFSINPAQGDLIYVLCRALHATRVAEFATSVGLSTIYFAAAMLQWRRAGHRLGNRAAKK
jgi:predicted O-methyltransferase YrrM